MSERRRVVVVGAGVIGLSVAHHLSERFPDELELTLLSHDFPPHTTSDKAGMILMPVDFRTEEEKKNSTHDQEEDIMRWTRATFQKFHSIYKSEDNAKVEITMQQGYCLLTALEPDPWWKDEVFGFRNVRPDSVEASVLHSSHCGAIWSFGTYIVDNTSYMNWLLDKVKGEGVRVQQQKISSFDELSSYDVIINCTGIASCDLLGDRVMYPNRGQVVLVRAPWVSTWLMEDKEGSICYILPRARDIVLGGTAEPGDWNETPDPTTAGRILSRSQELVPSLVGAEVIGEWAGLRPQRDPIRMESCEGPGGGSMLVHCYGHGGKGVVLSWGCALDIGDMIQKRLSSSSLMKANL